MSEKRKLNLGGISDQYKMFGMLFMLGNKLQTVGDNFYEEITSKQWFAIVVLELLGEESPTLMELAEGMGTSHQNVKQIVLKLEAKGYVELLVDDHDKRKKRIRLTEKKSDLTQKYFKAQQEFMEELFQGISAESLEKAVEILTRFDENLDGIQKNE